MITFLLYPPCPFSFPIDFPCPCACRGPADDAVLGSNRSSAAADHSSPWLPLASRRARRCPCVAVLPSLTDLSLTLPLALLSPPSLS